MMLLAWISLPFPAGRSRSHKHQQIGARRALASLSLLYSAMRGSKVPVLTKIKLHQLQAFTIFTVKYT